MRIQGPLATLSGTITEDLTLTPGKTWVLSGKVEIGAGGSETDEPTVTATLSIEAGTTIHGTAGASSRSARSRSRRSPCCRSRGASATPTGPRSARR